MHVSIGLSLGDRERVELLVSRADGTVYLVLGKQVVEIRLERVHVHALAKQLPVALAALARVDADATACRDAREVGDRAERLRGRLLDESVAADTVGDHERARELRGMADTLRAAADAVDAAVGAVGNAASTADRAAEDASTLLAQHTPPTHDQPP